MVSLGVDIGGTGCKCVAFDDKGNQLAIAYREYPLFAGEVNLRADVLFDSVKEVIGRCVSSLEDASQVVAVTMASFGESFVAVDKDGEALTDILLYFGSRQSGDFDRLVQKVGAERFMRIARIKPDASYSLSKMLYTKKVAERPVWKFLFIAAYVTWRLTGRAVSDVSLACRSLLYDVGNRCWSEDLLSECGILLEELPEVIPTGEVAGTILPSMAAELGLSPRVKVVMGAHDQIANALGAGVCGWGDAVDTTGTCECLTPLFPEMPEGIDFQKNNFACVPYLQGSGYVTYAYNISAGSVIKWLRDALGKAQELEAGQQGCSVYAVMNRQCPEEPSDLLVLPFLQGMGGTPDVDPSATGAILGLTTSTRVADLHRAVMEGITFEMRYNMEKLGQGNVRVDRLFACGGGIKTPQWLHIKADILGREIVPVLTEETGALGAAILGFAAVTGRASFDIAREFWRHGEPILPDKGNQALYERRYSMYKELRSFYMRNRLKEM